MLKKKILCLVLALCTVLMLTACGQQETFPNQPKQDSGAVQQAVTQAEAPAEPAQQQPQQINYDDGSYDPASEEGGQSEEVSAVNAPTAAPIMQSEYAGATPVRIDPVDKPTPTPLPKLTFSYTQYTAGNLRLTFEGPAGWIAEEGGADYYTLTNPDPSMDYAAKAVIHTIAVGKDYTQKELVKEVKAQADAVRSDGNFKSFDVSDTAARFFIDGNGQYIAYKAYMNNTEETGVAGRIIVNVVNKVLYILHVSYPRGLADTFADGVYNKIRHSMKMVD